MPKKFFDTLFIIDPNEKPAPSFLAVYIFTWFVLNKETTFRFIEAKGDFFVKLNAAIEMPTTYDLWDVLGWTFVLVVVRFILNNAIYFFRESSDHLTQFALNKLNMKSFIKSTVHQKTLDDLAKSKSDSHAFYDRAKAAEKSETDAINKLGEFEESAQIEHYELQQSIDRYKKELDTQSKLKDDLEEQLLNANKMNQEHMSQYSSLEVENKKLNATINILNKDLKSTKEICANWQSDFMNVKNNLIIWGRNSRKSEFELLYKNENDLTESDRELLTRLITTKIDFPEESP
jgi:hypothetical protein